MNDLDHKSYKSKKYIKINGGGCQSNGQPHAYHVGCTDFLVGVQGV